MRLFRPLCGGDESRNFLIPNIGETREGEKKKKKKENRLTLFLLSLNRNWQDTLRRGKKGAEGSCDK